MTRSQASRSPRLGEGMVTRSRRNSMHSGAASSASRKVCAACSGGITLCLIHDLAPRLLSMRIFSQRRRGARRNWKLVESHVMSPHQRRTFSRPAGPKIAVPTRTMVAPSATAISKSWLIPMESSGRGGRSRPGADPEAHATRENTDATLRASAPNGGIAIRPRTAKPIVSSNRLEEFARIARATLPPSAARRPR